MQRRSGLVQWRLYLHTGEGHEQGGVDANESLTRGREARKALRSRSNSEAVRRVIDERLAVETGLEASRSLRTLGGPDDVFGRAPVKKR